LGTIHRRHSALTGLRNHRSVLTPEVLRLVSAQDGVVSRAQLRAAGLGAGTLRRLVAAGVWEAHGRSALLVPGTTMTVVVRTRLLALNHPALLATGPPALALGGKSAYRRFLDDRDTPWMIGRPGPGWFAIAHPGARSTECGPLHIAASFSALVDSIRFLPAKQAAAIAMTAVQRGDASAARLQRAAVHLVGYPGVGRLREVAGTLTLGAQSAGERRLIQILRDSGITGWTANAPVLLAGRRIVIDVAFPEQRVALEFDGWAFHSGAEAFQHDRERQNLLANDGWLVLRFTWADLDDPAAVIAQILAALERRSAA
jgi:very-short-patch-repair endonuclease